MPPTSETLACPCCRTPLRFRELPRSLTRFPCPECQRPLEIDGQGEPPLVQVAPSVPATIERKSRSPAIASKARNRPRRWPVGGKHWRQWLMHHASQPLTVTWLVAGLAAAALIVAVVRERGSDAARRAADIAALPPNAADSDRRPPLPERPIVGDDAVANDVEHPPAIDTPDPKQEQATLETVPADTLPDDDAASDPTVIRRPPVVAARPVAAEEPDRSAIIHERLDQQIVRFEQPTPVPFDTMRVQLAELVAVPIWYDESLGEEPAAADVPVQTSLADATIRDVLDELARQANLAYRVESDGIRLVDRQSERSGVAIKPDGER